ncbi:MAG: SDR family oxidoreductase [Deltaproteobacteria bacterium]|nr:SDR family oxidoreductase [Deltaproteobacteria bacterium]
MARGRERKFDRKVVVLSGAAGGIGSALAFRFGAAGARLVLLDLNEEALAKLAERLRVRGVECVTSVCDVRSEDACEAAFRVAEDRFGGVDVVIANAGISHRSLFEDTSPEVLRRVMDVNFFGAVNLVRACLASVRARRGQLVAISSVAGFAPLVGRTGYAASKHALHGFFGSLRAELAGSGVDVMLVCPAFTDTPLAQNALGGDGRAVGDAGREMAGGAMTPEHVAKSVLRAAQSRRRLVPIAPIAHASLWLARLAPRLYERAMLAKQGGEFRG